MDLQNLFYALGIIFMLTILGILLGIALIIWYIRKRALELIKKPQDAVSGIASMITLKLRNWGR